MLNQKTRGRKQDPYSQEKLLLQVLKKGGEFSEEQLGEITTGEFKRGARGSVSVLRGKGYPIAAKNRINPRTGRLNKCYYYESNDKRWIEWALANGFFKFNRGAPTLRKAKRTNNQLQLL